MRPVAADPVPRSVHPQDVAAAALTIVGAAYVVFLLWRSFFYVDDFMRLSEAGDSNLTWSYLSRSVYGHLVPGWRLTFFVLQRTVGFHYGWVIALTAVLQALTLATLYALLTGIFGRRWWNCALVVAYAVSPALMLSTFWLSNMLHVMPALLMLLMALNLLVRHLRRPRAHLLALSALAVTVGLLFYEKVLLIWALAPLLILLIATDDGPWGESVRRGVAAILGLWRYWLALALPTLAFLWYYLGNDYHTRGPEHPPPLDYLRVTWRSWTHGVGTSLIGGPFSWHDDFPGYGLTRPSHVAIVSGLVVLAAAVALSPRLRHRSWRGWVFAAIGFLLSFGVVAAGRLQVGGQYGQAIGDNLAYTSDSLPLIAIGIGFAVMTVRPSLRIRFALDPRAEAGEPPFPPLFTPASRTLRAVAAISMTLYVAVCVRTDVRFRNDWNTASSRDYWAVLESGLEELTAAHRPFSLYDVPTPASVELLENHPYELLSRNLGIVRPGLSYDDASRPLYVVEITSGRLMRGIVAPRALATGTDWRPAAATRAAAAPSAGTCIPEGVKVVTLVPREPLPADVYVLEIDYRTSRPGAVHVTLGTPEGDLPGVANDAGVALPPNRTRVVTGLLPDAVNSATVRLDLAPGTCVSRIALGVPVPG